jgi:predicted acetyltransferase
VDGCEYLGRLSIRHSLTPWLLDFGGHIGYGIRPSARRRGHATAMFRACLPVASRLGIDPALLTCDVSNLASRRVIEAGGGVLEDRRGEKLRFWVPTTRHARS